MRSWNSGVACGVWACDSVEQNGAAAAAAAAFAFAFALAGRARDAVSVTTHRAIDPVGSNERSKPSPLLHPQQRARC